MDGLSLHYYVHPEGWEIKGSSTDFDADVWYKTLSKALYMETLIERHGAIMDEYDPDKKVGMIVDAPIRDFCISRIRCVMHLLQVSP